ncbi:KAP NTPase domain-containing protein [Acanthopleuribacter pedis]
MAPNKPLGPSTAFVNEGYYEGEPNLSWASEEFGFKVYADQLAEGLRDNKGPFTLGVYGRWGSGKTTFCQTLLKSIEERKGKAGKKPITIEFNAWQCDKGEKPVLLLLDIIAEELSEHDTGKNLATAFRSLIYGLKFNLEAGVPFFGKVKADMDLSRAIEREAALHQEYMKKTQFTRKFSELKELMKKSPIQIMIFVDDLDRCDPKTAIATLEEIKLLLNLPNTLFIFALNRRIFEEYLVKHYHDDFGVENFSVDRYIAKLIQYGIYVPKPKHALGKFIEAHLRGDTSEGEETPAENKLSIDKVAYQQIKEIIGKTAAGNPRTALASINTAIHLDKVLQGDPNKEIDVAKMKRILLLDGLYRFSPAFFTELVQFPSTRHYVFFCHKKKAHLSRLLHYFTIHGKQEDYIKFISFFFETQKINSSSRLEEVDAIFDRSFETRFRLNWYPVSVDAGIMFNFDKLHTNDIRLFYASTVEGYLETLENLDAADGTTVTTHLKEFVDKTLNVPQITDAPGEVLIILRDIRLYATGASSRSHQAKSSDGPFFTVQDGIWKEVVKIGATICDGMADLLPPGPAALQYLQVKFNFSWVQEESKHDSKEGLIDLVTYHLNNYVSFYSVSEWHDSIHFYAYLNVLKTGAYETRKRLKTAPVQKASTQDEKPILGFRLTLERQTHASKSRLSTRTQDLISQINSHILRIEKHKPEYVMPKHNITLGIDPPEQKKKTTPKTKNYRKHLPRSINNIYKRKR